MELGVRIVVQKHYCSRYSNASLRYSPLCSKQPHTILEHCKDIATIGLLLYLASTIHLDSSVTCCGHAQVLVRNSSATPRLCSLHYHSTSQLLALSSPSPGTITGLRGS